MVVGSDCLYFYIHYILYTLLRFFARRNRLNHAFIRNFAILYKLQNRFEKSSAFFTIPVILRRWFAFMFVNSKNFTIGKPKTQILCKMLIENVLSIVYYINIDNRTEEVKRA